ncbi:MAG TPA: AMP-binding protein, partial [Nevskiaceae bacterium]
PMHHMYGLETSVILPLVTLHSVVESRPAFPQDVRTALESVDAPRVLVTAPVHLRALLQARTQLPPLHAIISATAPLSWETARLAEQRFQTQVLEIYGCTEAGSVASRHTVAGASWRPLETMRIETGPGACRVIAPHLAAPVALHDLLEDDGKGGFLLRGRDGDIVKVGGKRASLATLTQCLLEIPGVDDGVVFQPRQRRTAAIARRLAAFVVAPRLRTPDILVALSQRVDPVFLPRPLRKIECLPRNATGKLPRQLLEQMLRRG